MTDEIKAAIDKGFDEDILEFSDAMDVDRRAAAAPAASGGGAPRAPTSRPAGWRAAAARPRPAPTARRAATARAHARAAAASPPRASAFALPPSASAGSLTNLYQPWSSSSRAAPRIRPSLP